MTELFDNKINKVWGDLKKVIKENSSLQVYAQNFSIYMVMSL